MKIAETERTQIEMIEAGKDAPFFFDLVNSPTWIQYIGDRQIHDLDAAEAYLRNGLLKTYQEHGFSYYVVRNREGIGIGACGFLKKPYLKNADFGFAFLPQFHRQGYGYESGRAVLDYGVTQFGFDELDAVTMKENVASIRLLEKLDFRPEGQVVVPDANEELLLYRWKRLPE